MNKVVISPFDLSLGFKDAVEVMSQYLTQHRGQDWFVLATCKYLTSLELSIPTKPISLADLNALTLVVERCDAIRANPSGATTRGLKKFSDAVAQIAPYLDSELGLTLDDGTPPNDVLNAMAPSLDAVVASAQTEYAVMKPTAFVPGSSYTRPPAPNEDYLEMTRVLDPATLPDAVAIAGGPVSSTSQYWEAPPASDVLANEYGPPPPEAFQ